MPRVVYGVSACRRFSTSSRLQLWNDEPAARVRFIQSGAGRFGLWGTNTHLSCACDLVRIKSIVGRARESVELVVEGEEFEAGARKDFLPAGDCVNGFRPARRVGTWQGRVAARPRVLGGAAAPACGHREGRIGVSGLWPETRATGSMLLLTPRLRRGRFLRA